MPNEKLTLQTAQSAIDCINDFWRYAKKKGFFDDTYSEWGPADIQAAAMASTVWIWRDRERVDGVCIYQVRDLQAPDATITQPWMDISILVVRAETLGDTRSRMKATFACVDGAVDEAIKQRPDVVGITAHFERGNADLRALVETWPVVTWEERGRLNRFWMRRDTFIPRFDQHVRDSDARTEATPPSVRV